MRPHHNIIRSEVGQPLVLDQGRNGWLTTQKTSIWVFLVQAIGWLLLSAIAMGLIGLTLGD